MVRGMARATRRGLPRRSDDMLKWRYYVWEGSWGCSGNGTAIGACIAYNGVLDRRQGSATGIWRRWDGQRDRRSMRYDILEVIAITIWEAYKMSVI